MEIKSVFCPRWQAVKYIILAIIKYEVMTQFSSNNKLFKISFFAGAADPGAFLEAEAATSIVPRQGLPARRAGKP